MNNNNRTFLDLADFREWLDADPRFLQAIAKLRSPSDIEYLLLRAGAAFFELPYRDAILRFRSNRYFYDALKVTASVPRNMWDSNQESIRYNLGLDHNIEGLIECLIADYFKGLSRGMSNPDFTTTQIEFLDEHGYLVIPNAVDATICDELYQLTSNIASVEAAAKSGYLYGSGNMRRIYHLLSRGEQYREIARHPLIHVVMSHMFARETFHEKYYLTSFHANILYPGAESQIWHIDANVPEPIPPWIIRANSNIISHDYIEGGGVTEVVPGSHKWCRKPSAVEAESHEFPVKKIVAEKGSIVFWHGHLWHRSGENTASVPRIALLGAYCASHFREMCQEENPYLAYSPNVVDALGPRLKRILGWSHGAKAY